MRQCCPWPQRGARLRLVKRHQRGLTLEMGMQSLRCGEQIVRGSHYHQLMDMQTTQQPSSASADLPASSSAPAPFFHALFEADPLDAACDRRLLLRLSSPIVQIHPPLLSALLTFFHVPATVDLRTFSAWSLQRLDALRSFSTATLAEALSTHSALDLNVDLTAPIVVVPLDPRSSAPQETADVVVLDLGHVRLTTELRGKEEAQRTLSAVREANGEEDLDADTRSRLFDLYHVAITRTSLFLSALGSRWAEDPSPSFLLEPLDLRLDVQSAVSKDVNWLPNFRVQGSLGRLQLRVGERKVRRPQPLPRRIQRPRAHSPLCGGGAAAQRAPDGAAVAASVTGAAALLRCCQQPHRLLGSDRRSRGGRCVGRGRPGGALPRRPCQSPQRPRGARPRQRRPHPPLRTHLALSQPPSAAPLYRLCSASPPALFVACVLLLWPRCVRCAGRRR